jgi:hypothetical protein
MKKFLGILAIAGVLVACNNSGSTSETSDSTKVDSIPAATTVMDSTKTDSTVVKTDSTAVKVDTTKAKK